MTWRIDPLSSTRVFEPEALRRALLMTQGPVQRQRIERTLAGLVRLASVSALPDRHDDVRRTAAAVRDLFRDAGLLATLREPPGGGMPIMLAELPAGEATDQWVTFYTHYDVQPADPDDGWTSAPFEPCTTDGVMYGRGVADSKGNIVALVEALYAANQVGGPPVNVRILLEGEEESGGTALARFVHDHRDELATDTLVLWDGGLDARRRPKLGNSLRGLLAVEIEARGADADLHSGQFGGVAPNPLGTLARIVGDLKDSDGWITIPEFYAEVPVPTNEDLQHHDISPEYAGALLAGIGGTALEGEEQYPPAVRIGARPTLDVHGISGGFQGPGLKTVIPAKATATISMRLVAGQHPYRIAEQLEAYVQTLTSPGVRVSIRVLAATEPVPLGPGQKGAPTLAAAMAETFGSEANWVTGGGSIPIAATFRAELGAPLMTAGIIGHDSNIHGPDEKLRLSDVALGAQALLRFLWRLPDEPPHQESIR